MPVAACELKISAQSLTFEPVGIDDLSDVRYIHAEAFTKIACCYHTDEEIAAFVRYVYSPAYSDKIVTSACYATRLEDLIVGTCGWMPSGQEDTTARIGDLYVSPLFAGLGIARALVSHAESRALEAGFDRFCVRVSVNAVPVFQHFGYEVTSHGVRQIAENISLPVTFMRKTPGLVH